MPNEEQATRDVAEVIESGTVLTQGTEWMMDPYPSRMIYRLNGADEFGTRFLSGERNIKVTYDTAFTSVPTAINRACRDESTRAFKVGYKNDDGGSPQIGLSSRTPSDGTVFDFAADELTSTTLLALEPYRRGHYV
jgi:hypothetical protein